MLRCPLVSPRRCPLHPTPPPPLHPVCVACLWLKPAAQGWSPAPELTHSFDTRPIGHLSSRMWLYALTSQHHAHLGTDSRERFREKSRGVEILLFYVRAIRWKASPLWGTWSMVWWVTLIVLYLFVYCLKSRLVCDESWAFHETWQVCVLMCEAVMFVSTLEIVALITLTLPPPSPPAIKLNLWVGFSLRACYLFSESLETSISRPVRPCYA